MPPTKRKDVPYSELPQAEKDKRNTRRKALRSEKKQLECALISVQIEDEAEAEEGIDSTLLLSNVTTTMDSAEEELLFADGSTPLMNISVEPDTTASSSSDGCMLHEVAIGTTFGTLMPQPLWLPKATPSVMYELPNCPRCRFCDAKRFTYEVTKFCCGGGDISLYPVQIPSQLQDLYSGVTPESVHFLQYIKPYNDSFSFTSMGVHLDPLYAKRTSGIYTFRAQGQIYHFIESLYPSDKPPCHLQLYFYDTENELANRINGRDNLQPQIISQLMVILNPNPYSQFFRSLQPIENIDDYCIVLRSDPAIQVQNSLPPSVSQVAAIWTDNDEDAQHKERDIIVEKHNGESHPISHYYGCYDPLQYPLLFPYGEPGWHNGIRKTKATGTRARCSGQRRVLPSDSATPEDLLYREASVRQEDGEKSSMVTTREFYAYRLQIRNDSNCILLQSGRLLQQFVVDMYVKMETSRLDYFRHNQDEIHAHLYQGIVDSIQRGESDASKIGRKIILPGTFIGGPRNVRKRFLDAMALVQRYGKPDLFLTMTCNPNWKEIKAELKPHEEAQNRPDLLARVFKSKLEHLVKEIVKDKLFGPVAAYTFVIEFQKRGMPHVHMLIILKKGYKLVTVGSIDRFISAELPDREQQPHLYAMVTKHMMHGPCGLLNVDNVCMKNGSCKNHYPRNFSDETIMETDGYPIYKREDNGSQVRIRGHMLDNRWVVPYNPYLLATFDCHINIEVCTSIKAVKYLYKYIYKGHDKIIYHLATSETTDTVDEIRQYQRARWISPPEAVWRIYRFALYSMQPAVITLQLHLEGCQTVSFKGDANLEDIVANEIMSRTMLTQFFWMNANNERAQGLNLLYQDFPQYFVWNDKRSWSERKQKEVIGRIITVNPSEGELYYLRLLLTYVRAPHSYTHLRTVDGVTYDSFREAAVARKILQNDHSSEICMQHACCYQMPISLRLLFCMLLIHCAPQDPTRLFLKFEDDMKEDYVSIHKIDADQARQLLLHALNSELELMGKNLGHFQLDHLVLVPTNERTIGREHEEELKFHISHQDLLSSSFLNSEQQEAYEEIVQAVFTSQTKCFFIDGPGGTGKTYLYRALLAKVRSHQKIALATATSGVAASLLPNGRTAHSRFKIPVENEQKLSCNVSKQTELAALLRDASLIIWDEASMANKKAIESLDCLLRDLMENELLFGGKVVVFGGDFRQVLPVIRRGTRQDSINASLVNSYIWPLLKKFRLEQNMRARADPAFSEYILRIGDGVEGTQDRPYIKIRPSLVLQPTTTAPALQHLIDFVFPKLSNSTSDPSALTNSAILTPRNMGVDELNDIIMVKFPGKQQTYYSFDETTDPKQQGLYIDLLHSLAPPGLPVHELILKPNCPVMLLRNINPSKGLCNGTRLLCKEFTDHIIVAEIAVGERKGDIVFIPRIPLQPNDPHLYPVEFKRRQFPVRLCFAMTINKAQGQTLDTVGVYLPDPVFSHGQLYVAISRATTSAKIRIYVKHSENDPQNHSRTKNIVYNEVLELAKSL